MLFVHVYGTLREGGSNHLYLSDSTFIGRSQIPGFDMYSLGRYPIILPSKDQNKLIVTECYEITRNTLTELDQLEGYLGKGNPENLFNRELIADKKGREAWLFVFSATKWPVYAPRAVPVPGGDWISNAPKSN